MSHCHEEHDGHEDHHHTNGQDHNHDHANDITPALQNLLYEQIDFDGIRTLNEQTSGSGRSILQKTWAQRLDDDPEVQSDADEQLIIHVPFAGQVRLHSLHIRTSQSPSAPRTLHLHVNIDDLDFSSASSTRPTQTLILSQTSDVQDLLVKRQLFNSCRSLTLFFEDNYSHGEEDVTRISYIAFKGDFMQLNREPVEVLYEAVARPSDHNIKNEIGTGMADGLGPGRQGY